MEVLLVVLLEVTDVVEDLVVVVKVLVELADVVLVELMVVVVPRSDGVGGC